MNSVKNLRIGIRLGLAFAVLLLLMLAMAGVGAWLVKSINEHTERYPKQILPTLRLIHQIDGATTNIRRVELQHILSATAKEKQVLEAQLVKARADLRRNLAEYEPHAADDEDRGLLKQVAATAETYFEAQEQAVKASNDSLADPDQFKVARELTFTAGRLKFVPLRQSVSKWWDYNEKLAGAVTDAAGAAYRKVLLTFAIVSAVATAIGVLAAVAHHPLDYAPPETCLGGREGRRCGQPVPAAAERLPGRAWRLVEHAQ